MMKYNHVNPYNKSNKNYQKICVLYNCLKKMIQVALNLIRAVKPQKLKIMQIPIFYINCKMVLIK